MTDTTVAPALPVVINGEALQAHLDDPRVVIVDLPLQLKRYHQAHVPGAFLLDFRQLLNGEAPTPTGAPSFTKIARLLSTLGISADTHVVAYDDEGGGWASRLLWTLALIGHTRYSLLDGGIHAWAAEKRLLTDAVTYPSMSTYETGTPNGSVATEADTLLATPERYTIWDTRSPEEYRGELGQARRKGHMPCAINLDWRHLFDPQNAYRLKPRATLQWLLDSHGLTQECAIVAHCQSHHRSSLAWLVGQYLGYPNLTAYPGAWQEWGNRADTPITH